MSAPGGSAVGGLLWGVSAPGVVVSKHALKQIPPWTKFLTHVTENITLPQT